MENKAEDIGLLLKAQREKLGDSLEKAAQHTRIRKNYLESLEQNRFADLPGQVYVTGFIRVYSRYLGLDSDALLVQLEEIQTHNVCSSLEPGAVTKLQPKRSSRSDAGNGWSVFVIGFLAVLVVGSVIYFLPARFQTADSEEAPSHKIVSEKVQPLPEVAQPVQEQADAAVVVYEASQNVGAPAQEVEAPSETITEKPTEQLWLPPVPQEGSSLRILALAESSLIIYVDDRKPQQYKLHNGLDLTWKIKRKVRAELSGPGVARFWLGGQELNLGETESFQLQPANEE